jgi:hypothetical protein
VSTDAGDVIIDCYLILLLLLLLLLGAALDDPWMNGSGEGVWCRGVLASHTRM